MSCLSIKFPPAKSAWKSFTSKLRKLHRSKAIKKRKTLTTTSINPFLPFYPPPSRSTENLLQRTRRFLLLQPRRSYYLFKKKHHNKKKKKKKQTKQKNGVVFVDTLFVEPTVSIPTMFEHSSKSNDEVPKKTSCERADEIWESMGLASPLMHGIDERAEEFIARIRDEMKFQERIARGL